MRQIDQASVEPLIPAQNLTASGALSGVDVHALTGRALITLDVGAGGGTTPTFDIALEESDDNVTFTAVAGVSFAQSTTVANRQTASVDVDLLKRYVRANATLTGTSPTYPVSMSLTAYPQAG